MKKINKLVSLVLVFAAAAFLSACDSDQTASISKPALVSKVTQYEIDYSSDAGDWMETRSYEYEYKDAYPVSLKTTEYDNAIVTDFEYEFEDGRPVSMTKRSSNDDGYVKVSYTKKGLVNRVRTFEATGRKVGEQVFQYGNRDEYFTLVLHENIISPPEEKLLDHMEEVDSVMITSENGLLRKTVNDGLFANYNDEEEKIWRRFDGTYTANFDDNGILDYTSAVYKTFPGSGNQNKFDLTVEDGQITEVLVSNWGPAETADSTESGDTAEDTANEESAASESDGQWYPNTRYVFEYTDTEISPARYASMINYFLLEGGGNYYIYNWY